MFSNKTNGIFSSPEFIFKTTEDDGRSVDSTILHRQIGYVTLASETLRGTFDIVDGDPFGVFEIDRDTGLISTQKSVDRERQAEYRLKVVVAVLGTKTFSECLVRIDIDDINDVIPSFTSNDNNVVFADGDAAIGQPLHRVEVEDGDLGENGRIGFTLEDKSGYFSIDPNQGNECFGDRMLQSVCHRGVMIFFKSPPTTLKVSAIFEASRATVKIVSSSSPKPNYQLYIVTFVQICGMHCRNFDLSFETKLRHTLFIKFSRKQSFI